MGSEALSGGFAKPAIDAARAFRVLMQAMARPGTIGQVAGARPPAPLSVAAGVAVLVLCDPDTPLYLAGAADCPEMRDWVAFHTGAPVVGRAGASFALGTWEALLPLGDYPLGQPEYPDRSATLIVEMAALSPEGARLCGPGIETEAALSLPEVAAFQANARAFPLGLDFILCCGDRVAALPRTTRVEAA